jgi:threonylcarbamoyladenosine tRNA methylthiotransferase MtaB
MKRRYNTTAALAAMERLRARMPRVQFTTDLMVGFPGETDEEFLETCQLVSRAGFLDCHVFAYSRRAGTPAADYEGQIPEDVKRARSEALIKHKNAVRDSVLEEICGRGEPISCIFEVKSGGFWTAHSDTFAEVRAESDEDLSGQMRDVIPVSHKDGIIYGKVL